MQKSPSADSPREETVIPARPSDPNWLGVGSEDATDSAVPADPKNKRRVQSDEPAPPANRWQDTDDA